MVDRLRILLDRPLDPAAGRAVLALASAIFLAFGLLVPLASFEQQPASETAGGPAGQALVAPPSPAVGGTIPDPPPLPPRRQDPQDRRGSMEARRAARALRDSRALQHVPYRRGELTIALIGADRGRAVLRVSAPNLNAADRGWRAFLRRYHDRGDAYVARFVAPDEGRRR